MTEESTPVEESAEEVSEEVSSDTSSFLDSVLTRRLDLIVLKTLKGMSNLKQA